jgi:hypothetical protein
MSLDDRLARHAESLIGRGRATGGKRRSHFVDHT